MNKKNQPLRNVSRARNKKMWAFILTLNLFALVSQGQYTERFRADGSLEPSCDLQAISTPTGCASPGPNYAPNGKVFTPKGDLKALIIYAGFGAFDGGQPLDEWSTNQFNSTLPTYVDPLTGASTDVFFNDVNDFTTIAIPSNTTNKSISRFYYEMSKGTFRFMADVFKDPNTGQPVRINIDPTGAGTWGACNTRVIQKIQQDYPNFDWSPYDNRTNWPTYQCDNSQSSPDMKPDYVVVIYRYNPEWIPQPAPGMQNWGGSGGGYSVFDTYGNINFNGYTFDGAGFTFCAGGGKSPFGLFLHELGHELYSAPHVWGANGTVGNRFYHPNGWSMMVGAGPRTNECANAWERWLLGWSDLQTGPLNENSDIQSATDLNQTGEYILRDFVTSGDAIRIKVPFTASDYIWMENHQKQSVFDHQPWAGLAPSSGGEIIPDLEAGLYLYHEAMLDDRDNITTGLVSNMNVINGLRVINAQGNYDYIRSNTAPPTDPNEYWGNILFTFERTNPNPLGGIDPLIWFKDDYPYPPQNAGTNNGSINHSNNYNNGSNESYPIIRQTNGTYTKLLYSHTGGRNNEAINLFNRRSDAFQVNDWINIGTNPTITNYPLYDLSNAKLNPTILSGISIKVLSQDPNGDMHVKIEFGYTDVNDDVRWCGNIQLNDINSNGYDVNLKSGKSIILDRNGIPNRHNNPPFINETIFTCLSNSAIHLESGSNLIIQNGSTLHLETGSQLSMELNSIIRVKTGCKLILDSKSTVMNNGGRIIIEDGGTLEYQEADITLATSNSTLEIAGLLDLKSPVAGAYNIFTFGGLGYIIFNSPQLPTSINVSCTPGDCIFQLNGQPGQLLLKVTQESLRLPVGLAYFIVEGGVCQFASNQRAVRVLGSTTKTTLLSTVFTSTSGNYNTHWGLVLYGGPASVRYSTFLHGYQGIYNLGGDLTVEYSTFQDCGYGIYSDGGSFNITNTLFDQNRGFGISADNMTLPCYLTSSEIKNTTLTNGIGVFFDGSLTSSLKVVDNYIHDNKLGIQMKNTLLTGSCNMINDNQTNGIELKQGGYLDFSGNPGARSNVVGNNAVSLKLAVARDLFLADGYNSLVPSQSGAQNAVRGTIKKPCPNPPVISANYNEWNTNGNFSSSDYYLTTVSGQSGCTVAMPVTVNDFYPTPFTPCSSFQPLVSNQSNPLYDCNNCETIYTSSFIGDKLNEAGLAAVQQTTSAGGNSNTQAVSLFNEMLMYNLPAPDAKEKYILNYSYAEMGAALGAAFKNNELSESDNSPALSSDVQKMTDVLNKQLAEAISNDDILDRFYYSLDKVNVYRLAGRRDLAFPVLDDMYNLSVPPDELDYLNYKNCITHLEQDLIDGLITTDEYMDASLNCEQQNSGLRVSAPQGSSATDENNQDSRMKNADMGKNITVSPNPATDKINIYNTTDKILTLVLKDPVGRVVYQSELSASANLECSEFSRGFYTIQLFDKQSNMVYKGKVLLK